MKAAANGALNMSVLDGWWDEGYQPGLGWAIGSGEEYQNPDYQNQVESQAIYNLLDKAVIPLFYERGRDNLPREWIRMMKKSMQTLAAYFNSHRMLEDYVHRMYLPAAMHRNQIESDHFMGARTLTAWINHLQAHWRDLKIVERRAEMRSGIQVGTPLKVEVKMQLGGLSPNDISVDIYYGRVDSKADFIDRATLSLHEFSREGDLTIFRGEIPCREVGRFGFRVRILPSHPLLSNPYSLGLILWG
jgi:starch phosphorylase